MQFAECYPTQGRNPKLHGSGAMSFRKGHCEKRCPTYSLISPKKPETSPGPQNREPAALSYTTPQHTTHKQQRTGDLRSFLCTLDTKKPDLYSNACSLLIYAWAVHTALVTLVAPCLRKYKSIWSCLSQDFASDYSMHQQALLYKSERALCLCVHFVNIRSLPTGRALPLHTQIPLVLIIAERKAPNNAQPHVQKPRGLCFVFMQYASAVYMRISFHRPNDENKIGSGSHIVHAGEYKKCA
jgi:hypothetical protein